MAPSLEVEDNIDLDAPLKVAPKLVAPEPGKNHHIPWTMQGLYQEQNTAQAPSPSRQARLIPARDVQTRRYAPAPQKGPIRMFH